MIKIRNTLSEDNWRRFVENHPQGNIFHTPEMFEIWRRAKGYRPNLWAAINHKEEILALLLPVQIVLISGLLRRLTTRSVVYGGTLCTPSPAGRDALNQLFDVYNTQANHQSLFTELRNLSDMGDIQPTLQNNQYTYEDHLNYLIDLDAPPETIMQRFGRRLRKQVRRAVRQKKVTIKTLTSREQLDGWYDVLQQTYRHAQVPVADLSLFKATFDVLHPLNQIRFSAACVGKTYAAVSVELLYKDMMYGWYGGVDRAWQKLYPNELLTWHILKWGAENGYKLYDFGGAGKPDKEYGVRDFKAKFGGELVCFGRNTCIHSPFSLKLSAWGYRVYQKLLKIL